MSREIKNKQMIYVNLQRMRWKFLNHNYALDRMFSLYFDNL